MAMRPSPGTWRASCRRMKGSLPARPPMSTGVRTDRNGQIVRLQGFIVPIGYEGAGTAALIFMPFVCAFVHVPLPTAT
ncbi:DUF3299 domain-containing protein [Salipiger sp. IMCC34102]|uniref:DUF3299 domain-containing protein n=1 Tax=Salipiger sp. IMCC34102 TaxID=2510647 RepID=UPI00101DC22C|nr:DUF3299 domain-containing protein [Salipiger sp. IMCC34102]